MPPSMPTCVPISKNGITTIRFAGLNQTDVERLSRAH